MLRLLARMLSSDSERWEMLFVLGGAAAMQAIDKCPFDVVMTDLDMPDVSGHDILRAAKEALPKAVRIVHTGSCALLDDLDADALIMKPCSRDELRESLERATALVDARSHSRSS